MASSRVACIFVAFAAASVAVSAVGRAEASCNRDVNGPATRWYFGQMGVINQPFTAPGSVLQIKRRICESGGASLPGSAPLPRTLMVVDPQVSGVKPAILIAQAQGENCQAIKDACKKDAGGLVDDVECVELASADYGVKDVETIPGVTERVLELKLPDPLLPPPQSLSRESGPIRVAVVAKQSGPPCRELIKAAGCAGAVSSTGGTVWHACIDKLYEGPGCGTTDPNPKFDSLTMLPPWNDFRELCFSESPYCAEKPGVLRYAVDSEGNMLIPVAWRSSLDECTNKPCSLAVGAAMARPAQRLFGLPANKSSDPKKSDFLESFTTDGWTRGPDFAAGNQPIPAVSTLLGRADEPNSVLRIKGGVGACVDANNTPNGTGCTKQKDCPGSTTCKKVCADGVKKGHVCANSNECDGHACGTTHDMRLAYAGAGWRLRRDDGAMCQAAPIATISADCSATKKCPGATPCVRYEATAADPLPVPTAVAKSVDPTIVQAFVALMGGSDAIKPIRIVQSADGSWAAGSFRRQDDGRTRTVLAIASLRCVDGAAICDALPILLESDPVGDRLVFVGDQLRFLTADPDGDVTIDGRTLPTAELWVASPAHRHRADPRPTRVGRVILGDAQYDPLGGGADGATVFLSPAGRCVLGGATLPVPSYCRPAHTNDCPLRSICTPSAVAVAIDLVADRNDDGVPDVLQQAAR